MQLVVDLNSHQNLIFVMVCCFMVDYWLGMNEHFLLISKMRGGKVKK